MVMTNSKFYPSLSFLFLGAPKKKLKSGFAYIPVSLTYSPNSPTGRVHGRIKLQCTAILRDLGKRGLLCIKKKKKKQTTEEGRKEGRKEKRFFDNGRRWT